MVAVYFRGSQLFDIDFTGGSSVTFTLNDKDRCRSTRSVMRLAQTELVDKNLLVVERGGKSTGYTVDTSEQTVEKVKEMHRQGVWRQAKEVFT